MSITGEERDTYWRSKDPLFSTPVNERAMEQYRRFAYVTWRFAVPNLGLRGWETHRGRVYLRYGEPLFIDSQKEILREMMDPVLDPDAVTEPLSDTATDRLYSPSERWEYEDLTFTFGGGMTTGNLKLWPSDTHYAIDSIADFERLAEKTPESAKVEGGRRIVEMETVWYRFESAEGGSEFVPVTQLPEFGIHGIRPLVEGVQVPVHFMILDDSWQAIKSTSQDLRLGRLGRVSVRDWVGDGISFAPGVISEGALYAAAEIVPSGRAPAFVSRDTLDSMPVSGLRLSSLVAATNVQDPERVVAWPANSYFTRFGQAILPRPSVQFELNEPIYLYYEIYGLTRDEIRATRYQIALTVTSQRERGLLAPVVDALGQLVGRTAQEGSVTLLFDRGGIQTRTSERLRMVFPPDRRADSYFVTIEVIDLVSGERFERSVVVEIGS
jgi:GWxTD domain-containing protein